MKPKPLVGGVSRPSVKAKHRVHACVGTKPEKVECAARVELCKDFFEDGTFENRTRLKTFVYTDNFLVYDPARADVLVPDFAVAHNAFGQSDFETARLDFGARPFFRKIFAKRRVCQFDSVKLVESGIVVFAPTVSDD